MRVSSRLEALDAFRGVTIAAMILVNNPGDWTAVFAPLMHAAWSGWTFADLVFPWFLLIVGVAMPFAFERRRRDHQSTRLLYLRIARRVVLLVLLGLVLNAAAAWPAVSPLRFPGVLQRIAFAYLLASVIVLHSEAAGWALAAAAMLAGHWALMTTIPFGGHAAGTPTPDQNFARYVDMWLFGRHALTMPVDPEGVVGTLTATATVLIGALAGRTIRTTSDDAVVLRRLAIAGGGLLVGGLLWSRVWLISKPLGTGSFVLVATGLGLLGLTLVYFLVEVRGRRGWARPFLWLGVNPLAIYFASEMIGHALDAAWIRRGAEWTTPKAELFWGIIEPAVRFHFARGASLFFAAAFAGAWIAIAGVLFRRGIRIQV